MQSGSSISTNSLYSGETALSVRYTLMISTASALTNSFAGTPTHETFTSPTLSSFSGNSTVSRTSALMTGGLLAVDDSTNGRFQPEGRGPCAWLCATIDGSTVAWRVDRSEVGESERPATMRVRF